MKSFQQTHQWYYAGTPAKKKALHGTIKSILTKFPLNKNSAYAEQGLDTTRTSVAIEVINYMLPSTWLKQKQHFPTVTKPVLKPGTPE